MKVIIQIVSIVFIFQSCKTAKEIKREEMVDTMAVQMQDNQQLQAEFTLKMQEMENKVNAVQGKAEELNFQTNNNVLELKKQLSLLTEQMKTLQDENQSLKNKLAQLEVKQKKQLKFVADATKTLKQVSSSSNKTPYQKALALFKSKKYKQALPLLKDLSASNRYKVKTKANIINLLGITEYNLKNYENSQIYFSKVVLKYSKKGYDANAFYYLGLIYRKQKKKDLAKESFQSVVKSYPKSWQAKQAKKLLKKL